MNKLFNDLKIELEDELKKFDINEKIEFISSKQIEFDLQINNLVKHKKNKKFENLCDNLLKVLTNSNYFENVEINSSGFINLVFNFSELKNKITNTESDFEKDNKQNILLDYGGPNLGKPLHVGHIRTLNIGRSIYNTNTFVGNSVKSDIHLGDWGMPIAQIISFIQTKGIDISTISAKDLENIYPEANEKYRNDLEFKNISQATNKRLNKKNDDVIEIWNAIKQLSLKNLEETFNLLNHRFDYWYGESDVNDLIEPMLNDLQKRNVVELDDGALISTEETNPKILITKSDGSYLYITTDLATVIFRNNNLKYDKALYIVDNRQSLHFKQLFRSINHFKLSTKEHIHVSYGTLNDSKGNPFKTREGGTKPLLELFHETKSYIQEINPKIDSKILEELTNSVLTFSDLLTNRKTDYKFDIEKFTNINGKTGIYVQYAYVRALKLQKDFQKKDFNSTNLEINHIDKKLLSKLFMFFLELEKSIKLNEPHHLAEYLYEISNLFNSFYEKEKFSQITDTKKLSSKIYILNLFITTSQNVMNCLGVRPVSKM